MNAPESLSFDEENPTNRKWLKTVMKPARAGSREAFLVSLFINLPALAVPNFVLQVYIHAASLVTTSARFLPS